MTGLILTILKYIFSLIFACAGAAATKDRRYAAAALPELLIIFAVMDLLLLFFRIPVWILSAFVMLLYNAQHMVLIFGGCYTTLVMLTNLDSWKDLLGKLFQYLAAILAILVFTCLPITRVCRDVQTDLIILAAGLLLLVISALKDGPAFSPVRNTFHLLGTILENLDRTRAAKAGSAESAKLFRREKIQNFRKRPDTLPKDPNIILIFTEGLSSHMLRDERQVMPNMAALAGRSLRFRNYYNHTYATYCALTGQLFSGYQLNNYDTNALVSLQSILQDRGYDTAMINPEPKNALFSRYLEGLRFDRVVTDNSSDLRGEAESLSDGQAYDLLWDTVNAQAATGKPFLTAIYTFGTHISFDSPKEEEHFGDGKDTTLNKLYNADAAFGRFLEKLEASPLAKDTILVLTGDHCAYGDFFYRSAFPDYPRVNTDADEMPLILWHRGVEPEEIDADGRNTLDMVPTLLDYLDISAPNYFLGESLFAPARPGSRIDTIFLDASFALSTEHGVIRPLTDAEAAALEPVFRDYFAAAQHGDSQDPAGAGSNSHSNNPLSAE